MIIEGLSTVESKFNCLIAVSHGGSVNHTESVIFFDTLIFEAIPTTKYA
jgi:hypothetical protein